MKLKNKGITLIALVITIIILLILAGVTISQLTENGLFESVKRSSKEYEKAQVKEELQLAVFSIQSNNIDNFSMETITEKLAQETNLDLDKLEWDSNQNNEHPKGTYKGYNFYVDNNYEIILGEVILENNEDILLEYSAENNNIVETKKIEKLIDKTGNGYDAQVQNISYNNGKGVVFDGSSTYATLDSQKLNLTFPITITATVKWQNGQNNVLFIDIKSKICIGTYGNKILLSAGINSYYYNLPENFLQNEVNYITILYKTSVSDNELYINGQKAQKTNSSDSWSKPETLTYLGRRASGSYFKGILYNFKIYKKLFSEQEVNERYMKEKTNYENNTNSINEQQEHLILEYLCNAGENEEKSIPYIIKNKINNNNIKLNNVEYDEFKKGLVFNGVSSYGVIEDETFEVPFPTTITMVANIKSSNDNLLFTNQKSKIGIGLWNNKYIILENGTSSTAKYYDISNKFLSSNINYITAVYENNASDNKLYLNGEKIESTIKGDGWIRSDVGTYLGRRSSGSYFNGILYKLKIYKKVLSENEILEEYERDKDNY